MRLALAAGQQALCRSPGFLPSAPRPTQAPRSCCAPWKAEATVRRQRIAQSPHRAVRMATAAGASGGAAAGDAFPRRAGVVQGGVHRKSVAYLPPQASRRRSGGVHTKSVAYYRHVSVGALADGCTARHLPTLQPGQCRVAAPAPRRGHSFKCHLVRHNPTTARLGSSTVGEKHG